jgi:5-formyltetrahydrofolate cyclo-ligase
MNSNNTTEKKALRPAERARRTELARACPDFAERIARYADDLPLSARATVGGYRALTGEADPSLLLAALQARGCELAYPRVHMKGQPLWFHVPVEHEPWVAGAFGILEPRPDWPRAYPSVLLVPLLAFDAEGYRLGYGGGYYDRTLAQFRSERPVAAIGVAFAGQEVEYVPRDASDQPLDSVVTELGLRRFATT